MPVKEPPLKLDVAVDIAAPVELVFDAFFDTPALGAWLGTSRAIAVPRLLGPYVLEWPVSSDRDDVLGRMGGIFRGTVMHVDLHDHVFLADAFWLPPDGGPLGPLAVQITFEAHDAPGGGGGTFLRIVMTGFDEGIRWRRYLDRATAQWQRGLGVLKMLLER
jgi:uncharacterized protein YndB with AHSA1/START domain